MTVKNQADAVIIGGGIIGATLSVLLQMLEPTWEIVLYERFDKVAKESSAAWNNAGNGNGILEFGTEIINNQAGTIARLLGASPGASTSVSAML